MIALGTAIAFSGVACAMALSPGPNLLYLAARSASQGAQAGFASLAGVCSAMVVYMVASAVGLATLFKLVPPAYDIVRLAGAAYLLWLAYKTISKGKLVLEFGELPAEPRALLYRRGFVTCLLNPKIVITYGALLPQFVSSQAGSIWQQHIELGLIQVLSAALMHSGVILCASRLMRLLRSTSRIVPGQRFLLAGMLTAIAARIIFERRTAS